MVVGVLVLVAVGAPRPVVALVAAMLGGLAAMTVVSRWSTASFHLAVAGGVTAAGLVVGWAAAAPLSVLLVVIAWARRRAGRHTGGQVVLGLLVGAGTAAAIHPALA